MTEYLLSLDQGTTSSRAILFNRDGEIVRQCSKEFKQIYPKPGWVEHNPKEIWDTQLEVTQKVIKDSKIHPSKIAAIGITNQRETTIIWDKNTGEPVYNAIVWQCRRTADTCRRFAQQGWDRKIRRKTGLVLDAYFSGTKARWILKHVPGVRERADKEELLFGTIDTWLIWKLTGGKVHATDYSNASRTMLYDINDLAWDDEILNFFKIPKSILPEVKPSSGDFGKSTKELLGAEIPISGVAGDQQAALFGQSCFSPGMTKCTYGTGSFMLMNTGEKIVKSQTGLLTTIAWGLDGKITYALEGSAFIAGAAIQWLRDEMCIIENAAQSEEFATKVEDTGDVYFVPAFVGLGAPHWDMYARGSIVGLTRGTNKYHIVRAALEAIAYQINDIVKAMLADAKMDLKGLRVDGGAVQNNFLMQFQADILQTEIDRPAVFETTALGAAFLAGLGTGFYKNTDDIKKSWEPGKTFKPKMPAENAENLSRRWEKAVEKSKSWV
ncbi:MAG: glycerol kinase GlpK [Desulfobacteraceae bacterium]|nr:glycerol kinase GlpK [Desulfobacteraceae bacterium]